MEILAEMSAGVDPNERGLHDWTPLVLAAVGTHRRTAKARADSVTILVGGGAHLPRLATPAAIASFGVAELRQIAERCRRHDMAHVRLSAWAWLSEADGRVYRPPTTGVDAEDRAWAASSLRKRHWSSWPLRQEAIARL